MQDTVVDRRQAQASRKRLEEEFKAATETAGDAAATVECLLDGVAITASTLTTTPGVTYVPNLISYLAPASFLWIDVVAGP